MEFAPFSGIDNADLKLIFPNEYDTVYDAATDLEWLFYGNEWMVRGEGRPWQGPDQDIELMREVQQDQAPVTLEQWIEALRKTIKQSTDEDQDPIDYDTDQDEADQDPLDYDYDYDTDQDLIKDYWPRPPLGETPFFTNTIL